MIGSLAVLKRRNLFVESDGVVVFDARSTEDIQGGTNGEIDFAVADARDCFEIFDRSRAASVGDRDWRPFCEKFHEI